MVEVRAAPARLTDGEYRKDGVIRRACSVVLPPLPSSGGGPFFEPGSVFEEPDVPAVEAHNGTEKSRGTREEVP